MKQKLLLSLWWAPWLALNLARSQDRLLFLVWGEWTGVPAESHSASGFSYSRRFVTWQLDPKAPMALKEGLKSLVPQQAMTFWLSGLGPEISASFSQVLDPVQPHTSQSSSLVLCR